MSIKINKVVTLILLALFLWNNTFAAYALVGGSTINSMSGVDSVNHVDNTTTINTNNKVTNSVINWQTFNVNSGETLNINFTKTSQTLLNNVASGMSTIAGQILSSGVGADTSRVIISNPNGIFLDRGSYVNTNALMLTTLGVTLSGSSIKFAQNATSPSNAGIVIKGQIGSDAKPLNGGLSAVSRGIVLDGADIFAGGDVTLVTAEGATFTAGTEKAGTAGKTTFSTAVASTTSIPPVTIKENVVDTALTDNLIVKSNSAIRSKNGKIYLTDLRNNDGAINIASSNFNSYGNITLKGKDIKASNSTIKATNSNIAITATNNADMADTDITSDTSTVGVTATNSIKVGNVKAAGNVALSGVGIDAKDIKSNAGYVSVNAKTGDLKVGNVDSYGAVTLLGKDIKTTGNSVKSATSTITATATNDLDAAGTDFETLKSSIALTATNNNLKSGKITSVGNVALSGVGIDAKDIKSNAGYVSVNAKTGNLKVGNVDSFGAVTLLGKDIKTTGNSVKSATSTIKATATNDIDAAGTDFETLKSSIALTATNNNLKVGKIASYGSVTLNGNDITSSGNLIKSKLGNISVTAKNNADFSNTEFVTEKGTVGIAATNTLKSGKITSVGNVDLSGVGIDAKDIKSSAGYVSVNAKTGDLKVGNVDSYGYAKLLGKDIKITGNSVKSATSTITATATNDLDAAGTDFETLKSSIALTATNNNLKVGKIASYGSVTLKGNDITSTGTLVKSTAGNISVTAKNNADFNNTEFVTEKGTVGITATNALKTGIITSVGNVALSGVGIDTKDIKSSAGYVSVNAKTGDLKVANVDSYGNVTLIGKDISNAPANTLSSKTGTISATASNNLKLYNLTSALNMTLKGTNSAIIVGASTPKDIAISSTYKSNIFTHNVTANKVTLSGIIGDPPAGKSAKALIDAEKDRIAAAEKAEADRIAAAEKLAADKAEADRIETERKRKSTKSEVDKKVAVDKGNKNKDSKLSRKENQNEEFQANTKSAAANEKSSEARSFQRTSNGFKISQRIIAN